MADAKRLHLGLPDNTITSVGFSSFAMNQSADKAAWIFKSATTNAITRVGFRFSVKTGTATTWKMSLQSVDATNGQPSGTILGGGTPASVTFTNASLSASADFTWMTLANSYTPAARGEDIAIVLEYDSGTAPSTGVNDLTLSYGDSGSANSGNPYAASQDNGAAWSKLPTPLFGYSTATAVYGRPIKTNLTQTYNSGSSPPVYALRFIVPTSRAATYKVVGARYCLTPPAAATNAHDVRLYSGTTILQDVSVDSEIVSSNAAARFIEAYFDETSLSTLTGGVEYRLAIAPTTTTSVILQGITVGTAADLDAFQEGQDWYMSSLSGGTWTDITTNRPYIELILDDVTAAAGGSGGVPLIGGGLVR